jgi:periplasmic divalent cation tolerance protein
MTDARTVYVTAADERQAATLARALLERRLIACANLLPGMRSFYRWQGAVHDEPEVAMLLKTTTSRVDAVIAAVEELHPYDTPCVVVWPIEAGAQAYLAWIAHEVEGPDTGA